MQESETERLDSSHRNRARVLTSVIGPSMTVRGTITDAKDTLTIKGSVDGTIDHQETLVIDEQGTLNAEINAREVVIHGRVRGNVRGQERVRIEATASVVGDILSERFSVEEGATVQGRVVMGPPEVLDQASASQQAQKKTISDDSAIVKLSTYQAQPAENADSTPDNKKPS